MIAIVCSVKFNAIILYVHNISQARPHHALYDHKAVVHFVCLIFGHGVVIADVSQDADLPSLTTRKMVLYDGLQAGLVGISSFQ